MANKLKANNKCSGCMACVNACKLNAIEMVADSDGFYYPVIDKTKCVNCGKCSKICNNKKLEKSTPIKAIASYNLDNEIKYKSSSGGIFSLFAEEIISKGGIVYGAGFNKNFSVSHQRIDCKSNLLRLYGSKYVQSNIGNCYCMVEEDLNNDKVVLFSGTPCQIFALKSYLGKKYENLITVEVICHGVPSPIVWEKYFKEIEIELQEKVERVSFRDKSTGWQKFSLAFYSKSKNFIEPCNENIYMKLFLENHILRNSCYHCEYAKYNRFADITLGDLWGHAKISPNISNNDGISAIIINTALGQKLFDAVKEKTKYEEVSLKEVIKVNKSFLVSPNKTKIRKNIDALIKGSIKEYKINTSKIERLKCFFKRVYNKIKIEIVLISKKVK